MGVDHVRHILQEELGARGEEKLVEELGRPGPYDRGAKYAPALGIVDDLGLAERDFRRHRLADPA